MQNILNLEIIIAGWIASHPMRGYRRSAQVSMILL